ncbi:MAG TPA: YifB family Mg chelatase-like AAA ATPase [Candidatus Paceibacterota bacterium]|nr:YifB family Mg chelatase-like AAA ATPase [Candidatus Paceibacterota bacterium]
MNSSINSAALTGLEAQEVKVEVDVNNGLHNFTIIGLPDAAIKEAKDRIATAIKNSGAKSPMNCNQRIVINLAPADLKKEGSGYDVAMAIGYLLSSKQMAFFSAAKILFLGELALDGKLRSVKGVITYALLAERFHYDYIVVPLDSGKEAAAVCKVTKVIAVESLKELIEWLEGTSDIKPLTPIEPEALLSNKIIYSTDFADIKGQNKAKRGLEIAAAGGHNLLLIGPPGTGKTLLAKAFRSILPPLSVAEALEITNIYSVAGLLPKDTPLITERPFRSPHHTSSDIAMVGGGANALPGEISLSHRGVLFLDELPEFNRNVLETLRQPLEEGHITISRAAKRLDYPSNFILIASMNPCPCGWYKDPQHECRCSMNDILRYRKKISGPLLDRIDMRIEAPRLEYSKIDNDNETTEESSVTIRQRVIQARQKQNERFKNTTISTNSEMDSKEIKTYCRLDTETQKFMERIVDQYGLSGRSYHRLLKLSRTIADLDESENIKLPHLAEAVQFRDSEMLDN